MADLEFDEIKDASVDQLIEIMQRASHEDPRYDNKQRAIRDAARAKLDSILYQSLTEATATLANHTQELAGSTAQIHDAATKISEAQGKLVEATKTLDTTVGGASRSSGHTAIAGLAVSLLIALASITSV